MKTKQRIADAPPSIPGKSFGDSPVVTLNWVAKHIGLHDRSRSNWTPLLRMLCGQHGIEVRDDDGGVACCLASDVERLGIIVKRWFDRPSYSSSAKPRVTIKEQGK